MEIYKEKQMAKVTYEVSNDRNFQTKQIKKHLIIIIIMHNLYPP